MRNSIKSKDCIFPTRTLVLQVCNSFGMKEARDLLARTTAVTHSLVREDSKNGVQEEAEFEIRIHNFEFYGTCFCGCLCNSVGLENELADEMGEQSEGERGE